ITVPELSGVGAAMVATRSLPAGQSRRLSGASAAASRASTWASRVSSPPHASRTYSRRRSGSGMSRAAWEGPSLLGRAAVMGASAIGRWGPVQNTMRETGGGPVTFFFSRSGPVAGQAVDRHPEPAAGVCPVLLGSGGGDAERGGRLLGGEAGEEPGLDQLGLARGLRFELPEGLVQGKQAGVGSPPPNPAPAPPA